jgi:hypothetical protein
MEGIYYCPSCGEMLPHFKACRGTKWNVIVWVIIALIFVDGIIFR